MDAIGTIGCLERPCLFSTEGNKNFHHGQKGERVPAIITASVDEKKVHLFYSHITHLSESSSSAAWGIIVIHFLVQTVQERNYHIIITNMAMKNVTTIALLYQANS